jgi:hypothetical protein
MNIQQIVDYVKLHWVTVLALGMAVWNYSAPTVHAYVANHPGASFWYGLAAVVVTFYVKSPITPTAPKP